MLNIVLTFDYEIFFGKNLYSEDAVLFVPTEQIVSLLNEYDVCGTFYADVCSVFAYEREQPDSDYPDVFRNQLVYLSKHHQDVQLHIHPHWESTRWNGDTWELDENNYRIHNFVNRSKGINADSIFKRGIGFINETMRVVDNDYKCISYRAGGFCIQPITEIDVLLRENGIEIDSSVAMMQKLESNVHSYDYIRKYDEINWEVMDGIYEVPVGAVKNNLFLRIIHGNQYKSLHRKEIKGEAIHSEVNDKFNRFEYLLNYNKTYKMMSLDSMPYRQLLHGLDSYYRKYDCKNKERYIAVICHPKCIDDGILDNMKSFIKEVAKQVDKYTFITMRQIYDIRRTLTKEFE